MDHRANITLNSDQISFFQRSVTLPSSLNLPKALSSLYTLSSNYRSIHFHFLQNLRQNFSCHGVNSTNSLQCPRSPAKSFKLPPNVSFQCYGWKCGSENLARVGNHASMNVVICGAPASGKGTQSELIVKKYGLVHVAVGDLLRDEIERGTDNGKHVKEFMEKGKLVPDELVTMTVRERLLKPDSKESGWLLDGYPRSLSQATFLTEFGFRPDIFIQLEVRDDILIKRVAGRRLDPVTGRVYHVDHFPPESDEITARLTRRFDDTEQKVKLRLLTHHENSDLVLKVYKDVMVKIDGNGPILEVFANIDRALSVRFEK